MIKKIIKYTLLMVLVPLVVFGGTNDRFSDINLKEANYVELPEIAVPSGNPSENTAWFYCKDSSGVSNLYFENDAGTVFNLSAPSYAGNVDIAGTLEVGGNTKLDGNLTVESYIQGSGTSKILGFYYDNQDHTSSVSLTVGEMMKINTNNGASGTITLSLPEASTVIGGVYRFAVVTAQLLNINPEGADIILGLTNAAGDSIQSNAPGDTVVLMAVDATNWVVLSTNNSANNTDAWIDSD